MESHTACRHRCISSVFAYYFLQIPICFRFLSHVLYRVTLAWHLTYFRITDSTLSLIWRYFILSSWYLYQVKSTVRIDLSLESLLWYLEWAIKLGTNVLRAQSLSSQYPCHLARMSEQVACTLSWSAYSSTNYCFSDQLPSLLHLTLPCWCDSHLRVTLLVLNEFFCSLFVLPERSTVFLPLSGFVLLCLYFIFLCMFVCSLVCTGFCFFIARLAIVAKLCGASPPPLLKLYGASISLYFFLKNRGVCSSNINVCSSLVFNPSWQGCVTFPVACHTRGGY